VYLELPPDDEATGGYLVPDWLFEAYAAALFPDMDASALPNDCEWITRADGGYLVGLAYSTWIWADYKDAAPNPDGSWDLTVTIGTTDGDDTMDETWTLVPYGGYNPDNPFDYYIAGMPDAIAVG